MTTIYVKTTSHDLEPALAVSIYSCQLRLATPAKEVARFNRVAKQRGVNATYELATEEQYWAHRAKIQAIVQEFKARAKGG